MLSVFPHCVGLLVITVHYWLVSSDTATLTCYRVSEQAPDDTRPVAPPLYEPPGIVSLDPDADRVARVEHKRSLLFCISSIKKYQSNPTNQG